MLIVLLPKTVVRKEGNVLFNDAVNKDGGTYYNVCGMVYIKQSLTGIRNSNTRSSGSGFLLLLSVLSFTINKIC